jgi:hypothetical protein
VVRTTESLIGSVISLLAVDSVPMLVIQSLPNVVGATGSVCLTVHVALGIGCSQNPLATRHHSNDTGRAKMPKNLTTRAGRVRMAREPEDQRHAVCTRYCRYMTLATS